MTPLGLITPLDTLGLTSTARTALIAQRIESVEALGALTPAAVHRLMPYCHAMTTLAQYRHWHNQRYPCPPPLRRECSHD